jgi:outer membrane protein assembly factor BamB
VSATHVLWHNKKEGSNASSPIYHQGKIYWVADGSGVLHCQDAATGETIKNRLMPATGRVWTSPVLADGKLYIVSQFAGVYVVAAQPKFELIAHNTFGDDKSRSNSSIAVSDGHLYLRNDHYLYCIGK